MVINLNGKGQGTAVALAMTILLVVACEPEREQMDATHMAEFAARYATAWSSQDPEAFGAFYAENGSLTVNGGEPSVGRDAVVDTARAFMSAFPDMVVRLVGYARQVTELNFIGIGPGRTLIRGTRSI